MRPAGSRVGSAQAPRRDGDSRVSDGCSSILSYVEVRGRKAEGFVGEPGVCANDRTPDPPNGRSGQGAGTTLTLPAG